MTLRRLCTYILAVSSSLIVANVATSSLPEASSTLLKMHKLYIQQSPHDLSLYDILQVSPNATSHEISKSYRRLSRRLHPDKVDNAEGRLQDVRQAYEVLKDDSTRLPYHRYGLKDLSDAVNILSGRLVNPDSVHGELLKLMGYRPGSGARTTTHQDRVTYLATQILERLRPLVEETVDENTLVTMYTTEFDQIKRLPMGSHILRCVGRAYRFSGHQLLRRQKLKIVPLSKASFDLTDKIRANFRSAKYLLTAAVASGQVLVADRLVKSAKTLCQPSSPMEVLPYFEVGSLDVHSDCDGESAFDTLTDEEIKAAEELKARSAVADAVQVEALWKVTKIELDRTVRKACSQILSGNQFFVSNSNSRKQKGLPDGWVSAGKAVNLEDGRIKAASAMILVGDLMVERSKDGTSWMD